MVTYTIAVPEETAAEFEEAAKALREQLLPGTRVRLTSSTLMALAVCGMKSADLCGRFELGLRVLAEEHRLPPDYRE